MSHPLPPAGLSRLSQLHLVPWPFRLVLLAVLGASVLTLALSELTVRSAMGDGNRINAILERQAVAHSLLTLVVDVETAQRGYLLLGEPKYLEPYDAAVRDLRSTALDLRRLLPASSSLASRLDRIDELITRRLGFATTTITLAASGRRDEALQAVGEGHGRQLMDEIRAEMRSFQLASAAERASLQARRDAAANGSRIALLLSTLLAIVLLLVVVRLAIDQATAQAALRSKAADDAATMQEVITSRTADLASLSSHLQVVGEKEKAELARNLHDEMGGLLTAARMDLSWLQGAAAGKDPAWLDKLQQLANGLSQAMDVKRRVVESLRPALLDHFGLPTALQNHFDETCRKAGLNCMTKIPEEMANLPDEVAIALFRVGQESLTNIVRHAQAKNVHLEIVEGQGALRLEIRDDGSGMDIAQPGTYQSYGLAGMRHRVEGLGGQFELSSQLGKGTRISITIPVSRL